MSDADAKEFWSKQTTSLHRSDNADFYRLKAEEHAQLMTPEERSAGCVDLGCGAGELLLFLTDHVKVTAGIDFSPSMLSAAQARLAGKGIDLLNEDLFHHLPQSHYPVWVTTGAINQYLGPQGLERFLSIFERNTTARTLCLFDCVDPIRYSVFSFGISYRQDAPRSDEGFKALLRPLYRWARRAVVSTQLALGRLGKPVVELGRTGMGYGYLPRFWLDAAAARGFDITIVSSRFYEYRYHVILRKTAE